MKPHQALIEEAEAFISIPIAYPAEMYLEFDKRLKALVAAISSAKAAEEGVETKYQVTRLEYRGNLAQTIDLTEKESAKVFDSWSTNMAAYHDQAVSLLRKDTYTTVISVREKEGLHGQ